VKSWFKPLLSKCNYLFRYTEAFLAAIKIQVGRYKLNAGDPQLETAWFQTLSL
jgi:hypothetical protein